MSIREFDSSDIDERAQMLAHGRVVAAIDQYHFEQAERSASTKHALRPGS